MLYLNIIHTHTHILSLSFFLSLYNVWLRAAFADILCAMSEATNHKIKKQKSKI